MTVRLLAALGQYPANAIVTFAAAVEASLVAEKIASTDLTGGVVYQAPVDTGRAGEAARWVTDADGNPVDLLLPGAAGRGGAAAVVRAGTPSRQYPPSGQIKWASYGDSIANISSYANYDLRQISGGSVGLSVERMGAWVGFLSNGLFRCSANCGVSGETTAQMITRESANASATRKSIADAASTGAAFAVNSLGINDIKTLSGASSASTIESVISTAVSNATALLKRQVSYGIYPITPSLLGYSETGSAADIAVRKSAVRAFNSRLSAVIADAAGALGSFIDAYPFVTDSNGSWLSGYDQGDGLHPGANGCRVVYGMCVAEMLRVSGVFSAPRFAYAQGANLVANADFSASSSGTATGLNIFTQAGTCTLTKSIVDWRGANWQEVLVTPTALDGNGNAGVEIDITIVNTTIALSDVIGGEVSLYIDDGAGGAPAVFQYAVRCRGNTTFVDMPLFNPTISPKVLLNAPVDGRVALSPIIEPAATPATSLITIIALTNSLTPFRVRVALPVAYKLASTY